MATPGSLLLGFIVGVLATTNRCSASVFVTDQLESTFKTLGSRQCLPGDFDASDTVPLASASAAKVTAGGLPAECAGAPVLALFYNCFASSNGLLNADATSFDFSGLEQVMLSYTKDRVWNSNVRRIMAQCRRLSVTGLTARQEAVFSYSCLKWSLFADCDQMQEDDGSLDAAGKLRRASFLSGDCPLSLSTLEDVLERITDRTLAECSRGLYSGGDADQLYDAQISRIVCLLESFTNSAGNIDFPKLRTAVARGQRRAAQLLKMVNACGTRREVFGTDQNKEISAREFAECWAGKGIFSCVYQQANQVASQFPDSCAISVDAQ